MNILAVGVFDIPWSSNICMTDALEKLGHKVTRFSYREIGDRKFAEYSFLRKSIEKRLLKFASACAPDSFLNALSYSLCGRSEMRKRLLETVRSDIYDLVLLIKTDSLDYRTVAELRKHSKTWYYFMDWMGTAIEKHVFKYASNADYASSNCSDVCSMLADQGAHASYLTQGVNTDIFFPGNQERDIDVCFVGDPLRERTELIDYLKDRGVEVSLYGPSTRNGPVYQEQLADLYRRSKIILNLSRCPYGFSIRVFQAMGAGAMVISERTRDLEKLFVKKQHLEWFNSRQECLSLLKHYLSNDPEREAIAKDGSDFVASRYSWPRVMEHLIDAVQGNQT